MFKINRILHVQFFFFYQPKNWDSNTQHLSERNEYIVLWILNYCTIWELMFCWSNHPLRKIWNSIIFVFGYLKVCWTPSFFFFFWFFILVTQLVLWCWWNNSFFFFYFPNLFAQSIAGNWYEIDCETWKLLFFFFFFFKKKKGIWLANIMEVKKSQKNLNSYIFWVLKLHLLELSLPKTSKNFHHFSIFNIGI